MRIRIFFQLLFSSILFLLFFSFFSLADTECNQFIFFVHFRLVGSFFFKPLVATKICRFPNTRFRKFFRAEFAKYGNRKKRKSVKKKKLKNMYLLSFFFQIYWTICKGLQLFMARDRLQFLVSAASHIYTVCLSKIDKSREKRWEETWR